MTIVGLGCPNRQWETFTPSEERAILDLHPGGLFLLGYPSSPVLSGKTSQEARLWEALGRPRVLLRPYAEGIAQRDPGEWAAVCVGLWRWYASYGIQAELIPANELQVEGMGNDWPRMADWLVALAEEVLYLEPGIRLHLPALSPGVEGYRNGWDYLAGRDDILRFYPIVDIHCYTEAHIQEVAALGALFGLPIACTEVNSMPPSFYVPRLKQVGCEESYWFILKWIDPEPGAPNVDLMGSAFYDDFKETVLHQVKDGGGEMPTYSPATVWKDYQAVLDTTPMFQKVRAANPQLGDALEPERDYGNIRVQFYAGGIIWARIGDWTNTKIATKEADLPFP